MTWSHSNLLLLESNILTQLKKLLRVNTNVPAALFMPVWKMKMIPAYHLPSDDAYSHFRPQQHASAPELDEQSN